MPTTLDARTIHTRSHKYRPNDSSRHLNWCFLILEKKKKIIRIMRNYIAEALDYSEFVAKKIAATRVGKP